MQICNRVAIFGLSLIFSSSFAVQATLAAELTTNGGFETGDFSGWVQFPSAVGNQTITSTNPSGGTFAAEIFNEVETTNSFFRQSNLAAGLLTPFQTVTVSFDARGTYGIGGVAFPELFSEIDGGGVSKSEILGGGPLSINSDPDVWTTFMFNATLGNDVSGGVTLQLGATNGAVANETTQIWYDNVSVVGDTIGGTLDGDFNDDGIYDCLDVDGLVADIAAMSNTPSFDLDGNGTVDTADLDDWLLEAGEANIGPGRAYLVGDANLDSVVDVGDFNIWNGNKFSSTAAWCDGDFNADGVVDVGDFNLWNSNKFSASDVSSVPEPSGVVLLLMGLLAFKRRR